ncbi:MAG: paraquat-inducible protein A [Burkholderiales bacterium]|nr:paraquat-inducible protein A [Burkholderiales bacterium]
MHVSPLLACPECDLLLQESPAAPGQAARCRRCGASLYRGHRNNLESTLALTLAAVLLFVLANIFPLVTLEVQGSSNSTTLFGTVVALTEQGRPLIAGLVFATTILVPALQLAATMYLLLPLHFGRMPRHSVSVLRLLEAVRPWDLVDVFVLGVLVAMVRLTVQATVVPGIGLASLLGLMVLLSAAAASFSPRVLWGRLSEVR